MQSLCLLCLILIFTRLLCQNISPELRKNISDLTTGVDCNPEKYLCSNKNKLPRICKCDDNCLYYGDCCYDKWKENKLSNVTQLSFSCITLDKHENGFLAVSSCSEEYLDSEIESKCMKNVQNETYTHILDIPVTSEETGLTYQNYFCAICNNDAYNLINTSMTMECINQRSFYLTDRLLHFETLHSYWINELLGYGTYNKAALEWRFNTYSEFLYLDVETYCKLRIELYKDLSNFLNNYNGRECFISTNEENRNNYNKNLQNIEVWNRYADNCDPYNLPVYNSNTMTTFKNPSCIDKSKGNYSCVPENSSMKLIFDDNSNFTILQPSSKAKYNFSLDMNSSFGMNGEWSTFLHKCAITENATSVNCTIRNEEQPITHLQPCLSIHSIYRDRELIEPGEYTILKNISLLVDNTSISRYTILNNSEAYICQPKVNAANKTYHNIIFGLFLISLLCLITHCVLYLTSKKKTWHERNLFCLCITILFSNFDRIMIQIPYFGQRIYNYFTLCYIIFGSLNYFNLSTAIWMNIISIHVYRTFKSKKIFRENKRKTFIFNNIYGWLFPFVLLGGSAILNYKQNVLVGFPKVPFGGHLCFMLAKTGFKYLVSIPTGILLLINIGLFVATAYSIFVKTKESKFATRNSQSVVKKNSSSIIKKRKKNFNDNKKIALIYLKLALLQGITWSLFYATSFLGIIKLSLVMRALNAIQGIIIFIFFDFKMEWLKWIKHKVCILFGNNAGVTPKNSSGNSMSDMSCVTQISYNTETVNTTST